METQSFIDWIQEELAARDWNQSTLAAKSGVSQTHLSKVFSGARSVTSDLATSLAKAFDLPPENVFRKAGLLPPTKEELDEMEREWMHIFDQALDDKAREELIERARFELERIRERRSGYGEG